jgi:prephenate dehydratase
MKIGYQGIKGAYSEAAIYKHYGKNVKAIGYGTFEEVFEAVKKNKVDLGCLPFENTIAGSVTRNYDLLLKENVSVIAEIFIKISHNLLSHKGNKISNIKIAYSHPHSLDQCQKFLAKHKIKAIPDYDTAGAARLVEMRKKKDEAAIASRLAADIYGLQIIKKDIETNKHNTTKFFIIAKKSNIPKNLKKEKTSIAFKTKHYPGALLNCLQRLSKNDINMTKLESRPVPETPWEYVFYVDFIGSVDDKNVVLALSEMETAATFIKILGSYPRGSKR